MDRTTIKVIASGFGLMLLMFVITDALYNSPSAQVDDRPTASSDSRRAEARKTGFRNEKLDRRSADAEREERVRTAFRESVAHSRQVPAVEPMVDPDQAAFEQMGQ